MSDAASEELKRQVIGVLRERMKTARKLVADRVRAAAPMGKTGQLKASVKSGYKESPNTMRFIVKAGRFARFLEFGTRKNGSNEWRIKPKLWFEKAFLSAMPEALNILQGK